MKKVLALVFATLLVLLMACLLPSCYPAIHEKSDIAVLTQSDVVSSAQTHYMSESAVTVGDHYIPKDEWIGLETVAYPSNFIGAGDIVAHQTGSPDPLPEFYHRVGGANFSMIQCELEALQYSLGTTESIDICVEYSVSNEDLSNALENIHLEQIVNIEYWNGESWDRLIYVPPMMYRAYNHVLTLHPGETLQVGIQLPFVFTKMYPGKYRAVVYLNYEPIYIEFEMIE